MKTTYDVAVHKAISLAKGESLRSFTNKLREQGQAHMLRKLNLTEKTAGVYLVEVFNGACVFTVYKYDERGSKDRYYAVKFDRKEGSDTFEFSDSMEVERVSSFQPKKVGVSKAQGKVAGCGLKKGEGVPVQKPYPGEHAARMADPKQFDKFRRGKLPGAKGIDAIYGIKGGKSTVQAYRFDVAQWTAAQAKAWLKENGYKPISFEEAKKKRETPGWMRSTKSFWSGVV